MSIEQGTIATGTDKVLLTIAEVAELLRVNSDTVRRWRYAKKLPQPVRVGHRWP